ncbi:MAG: hypothetical protein GX303_05920 [Clostridiales bacterium]|nr:hypothetical protein [Clostridiales bacterium]
MMSRGLTMFSKGFGLLAFSAKNIRYYPLGYIGIFFVVLISIVAFLLGIIMYDNMVLYDDIQMKNQYNHHIVFESLTEDQMLYLSNNNRISAVLDNGYNIVNIINKDISGISPRYDVYILFKGSSVKNTWKKFSDTYLYALSQMNGDRTPKYTITPRYYYEINGAERATVKFFLLTGITCLSAVFVAFSYFLRIWHSRKIYGIYTMLGARFKKLYAISVGELAIFSFVAFFIAFPIAAVVAKVQFSALGHILTINPLSLVPIIPFLSVIIALPPIWSMKKLAHSYPRIRYDEDSLKIKV